MLRFEGKDANLGEIYKSHILPGNRKSEYCCAGIGMIYIV